MTTHRHSYTKTYSCWKQMLQRCSNPRNPSFPNYGGRGITVCERWQLFSGFLADMGEAPADRSIERRDNSGGYRPDNCFWATRTQQQRNTRRNVLTMPAARLIRAAHRIGVSMRAIGRAHGISHNHVGEVVRGELWKEG